MSGRAPEDIWQDAVEEGERRLHRGWSGLAATGFAGGGEVALGVMAVVVVTGAAQEVVPAALAHVLGATVFGIAFVLITLGRAELFTENFQIPIAAVRAGRATTTDLLRMWALTLVFNLLGLAIFLGLLAVDGVLDAPSIAASGPLAETYAGRELLPAFVSAVIAGTVMTLFTWVVQAAVSPVARILVALLVGFLLIAPSLNHAVVSFGEILFGLYTGAADATLGDLWRNLAVAIAGNLIGGAGIVYGVRLAQVRGEPGQANERGS